MKDCCISEKAVIGEGVVFGKGCVVEDGAVIGSGTVLGNYAIVKEGTQIGSNCIIGDFSVIGKKPVLSRMSTARKEFANLVIEDGVSINSHAVVFAGSVIETGCVIGDQATIRERVRIGRETVVGRGVCIENDVQIGKRCRIQTNAYITAYTVLEDYVFIAPCVTTTNDNFMGRTEKRLSLMRGPVIKKGARVGGNAIILPGVVIGEEAFVAAGSVVTRDVEPKTVVKGVPARFFREVPEEELLPYQNFYDEEE